MSTKLLLAGLGLALLGLAGFIVERARVERTVTRLADNLLADAAGPVDGAVRMSDLTDMPPPVQRYLRRVLRDGQPYVTAVRLEQRGTFRSDATGPWRPFTASQHVTVRPPGFVWDASIEMGPLVPVRVLDAYHDGRGILQARLGGAVPVMDAEPSPALDEGELLRYLAEAPLYPTALLPAMGVTWTPIDDRSARATLTDQGTTATLVFHFDEADEVVRVEGKRGFTKTDGTAEERPWRGYWRSYAERAGMRVPTRGEVAWVHPDVGEVSYWRGHVEAIEYSSGDETALAAPSDDSGRRSSAHDVFRRRPRPQ